MQNYSKNLCSSTDWLARNHFPNILEVQPLLIKTILTGNYIHYKQLLSGKEKQARKRQHVHKNIYHFQTEASHSPSAVSFLTSRKIFHCTTDQFSCHLGWYFDWNCNHIYLSAIKPCLSSMTWWESITETCLDKQKHNMDTQASNKYNGTTKWHNLN